MRKFIIPLLLCVALAANSQVQVGYEDFYSENQLKANLQLAKTPAEQIEALGILANHYKGKHQDSLGNIYFNRINGVISGAKDELLNGRAQWWTMSYKNDTVAAKKLVQFAKEHQQFENEITANVFLSNYYIHTNHFLSDKYVMDAKESLDKWKSDTVHKDSLRVEVYHQAAHINKHRLNGRNVSYYLLALWDIADHHPGEEERISAMFSLADIYGEWDGHNQEAFPWLQKIIDHFRKANQPNLLLAVLTWNAMLQANYGNKDQAIQYLKEEERLSDSLGVFGFYNYWLLWSKYDLGLISRIQALHTLDDHFGNRLFLHQGFIDLQKAYYYFWDTDKLDSARYYMLNAKRGGEDISWLEDEYDTKTKNYQKLLQHCRELEKIQKERGLAEDLKGTYNRFRHIYEEIGNYKLAYEYYGKYWHLRDSLDKLKDDVGVATLNLQKTS